MHQAFDLKHAGSSHLLRSYVRFCLRLEPRGDDAIEGGFHVTDK